MAEVYLIGNRIGKIKFPNAQVRCYRKTYYIDVFTRMRIFLRLQRKYLEQIEDLYCDFHITKIPLFDSEVRGLSCLHVMADQLCQNKEDCDK